ncbi:MAG: hypothetical protein AB7P21_17605 [Lautropia sp.]
MRIQALFSTAILITMLAIRGLADWGDGLGAEPAVFARRDTVSRLDGTGGILFMAQALPVVALLGWRVYMRRIAAGRSAPRGV